MHMSKLIATLALAATSTVPLTSALALPPVITSPAQQLAQDAQNAQTCGARNPAVNRAISAFCNPPALIVAGTPLASNGLINDHMKVSITGPACASNTRWVPTEFCLSQFHWMCAQGDAQGQNTAWYGIDNCQTWRIETCGILGCPKH